jgi:hypothetical protein
MACAGHPRLALRFPLKGVDGGDKPGHDDNEKLKAS